MSNPAHPSKEEAWTTCQGYHTIWNLSCRRQWCWATPSEESSKSSGYSQGTGYCCPLWTSPSTQGSKYPSWAAERCCGSPASKARRNCGTMCSAGKGWWGSVEEARGSTTDSGRVGCGRGDTQGRDGCREHPVLVCCAEKGLSKARTWKQEWRRIIWLQRYGHWWLQSSWIWAGGGAC